MDLIKKKRIMKNKIIIGSRGSALALWQTNFVKRELEKINKNLSFEIKIIKTVGDKIIDSPLSKIGDKGLFTKELENELLNNNIDLAVHSLKDIQTNLPDGLKISAVTKRYPNNDVLIAKEKDITLKSLRKNAVIATGSLRRKSQLLNIRPDFKIEELRGNVPTRIEKFLKSNWDGIILALAGIKRLGLQKYISQIIPKKEILPAVGQGVLAIEINEKNKTIDEILKPLHDEKTYNEILSERSFLKKLQGGCQVPIGVNAETRSNNIILSAYVGSVDGKHAFRKKLSGKKDNPEKIGVDLAEEFISSGAKKILDDIYLKMR